MDIGVTLTTFWISPYLTHWAFSFFDVLSKGDKSTWRMIIQMDIGVALGSENFLNLPLSLYHTHLAVSFFGVLSKGDTSIRRIIVQMDIWIALKSTGLSVYLDHMM